MTHISTPTSNARLSTRGSRLSSTASLLVPALRWDTAHGFTHLRDGVDDALELGVGGFFIRGGPRDEVASLIAELHERSRIPLLVAAAAERGAGQLFEGCIGLPPLGALGTIDDPSIARRAARVTARDLKTMGINWVLGPVCDVDVDPGSAIVGTRGLGGDRVTDAAFISEWVDACQAEGVLACAKHFPGHGRAPVDTHVARHVVREPARTLWSDMLSFRAAIDSGVASVMTAHVAYHSLDRSGVPATISEPILTEFLRKELGFDGLIVSDSLEMEGLLAFGDERAVAEGALRAGCDMLLAPADPAGLVRTLDRAQQQGALQSERVHNAQERREQWAVWARPSSGPGTTMDDVMWARQLADRSVQQLRGAIPDVGSAVEVIVVDDDADGPWPAPARGSFAWALRAMEVEASVVAEPSTNTNAPVVILAVADVTAWKNSIAFGAESLAAIERALFIAHAQARPALVVLAAHPRSAAQLTGAVNVLCVWGGEQPMLEAAARAIVSGR